MNDSTRVLVTVPNTGWMRREVAHRLIGMAIGQSTHNLTVVMTSYKPYEHALHRYAKHFRESDCQFWLNMDADNPPLTCPLKFTAFDLDYIGFPTPILKFDAERGKTVLLYNVIRFGGGASSVPAHGLETVEAVGTGSFLMARRVADHSSLRQMFVRTLDADGCVVEGNDVAACRRMREAGFAVHAAWDCVCGHYNEIDLATLVPIPEEVEAENEPRIRIARN